MSERVTEAQVKGAATEIFRPEGVDIWYDAPNTRLHNATPAQYVRAGDGDKVLDLIEQLASGAIL